MSQLSFNPKEVVQYIVELGKLKVEKKVALLILQGIMAGAFISFGGIAFVNVFANTTDPGLGLFLASAIFPVGIIAILLLGFELVTSNMMIMIGVYGKSCKTAKAFKMLGIVWLANLVGTILIALIARSANIFTPQMVNVINTIGEAKANLTYWEMLLRGILCNMLVCAGVLMALTAKDNISKIITIWFPIVVFILCRAEHIVANMFFLPMAYLTGANISIFDIINNFFFVTVGNFIGGALIIGGVSYMTQIKEW